MKEGLVSIVVPVYNTQDYLDRCIQSILNQTYSNLEICVIDDGSTDGSAKKIQEYAKKDSRIRYYYQKNKGPGMARNVGIQNATGSYITFIDSDDYVKETYVEKLLDAIQEEDIMAICGTINVSETTKTNNIVQSFMVEHFRGIAIYRRLISLQKLKESHILYSHLFVCEDLEFFSKLYMYCPNYSIVEEPLYYYYQRENSLIHSYHEKQESVFEAIKNIETYAKEIGKWDIYYEKLEYLNISHLLLGYLKRKILSGTIEDKEIEFALQWVEEKYPDWYHNTYLQYKEYIPSRYNGFLELLYHREYEKVKTHFQI